MTPDQIGYFLHATTDVFSKMLRTGVEFERPSAGVGGEPRYDVSGIIGMSGDLVGAVVLNFPTQTAKACVKAFVGSDVAEDHPDFPDAIGELANMVSGAAKAKFVGKNISISCPSVIIGEGHTVQKPSQAVSVRVPCRSALGAFNLDIWVSMPSPAVAAA